MDVKYFFKTVACIDAAKTYALIKALFECDLKSKLKMYNSNWEDIHDIDKLYTKFKSNPDALYSGITSSIVEWYNAYNLLQKHGVEDNKEKICNKYGLEFIKDNTICTTYFLTRCLDYGITFEELFTLTDIEEDDYEVEEEDNEIEDKKTEILGRIADDLHSLVNLLSN